VPKRENNKYKVASRIAKNGTKNQTTITQYSTTRMKIKKIKVI